MAAEFKLDPVAVLEETDTLRWLVRIAAFQVVQNDRAQAQAHANQHRRVRGSR